MKGPSRSRCIACAVMTGLVTSQGGHAQVFNYTSALSGWTGNFSPYPSAQARPSNCSLLHRTQCRCAPYLLYLISAHRLRES